MNICSVNGCGKKHHARGFCIFHYNKDAYKRNHAAILQNAAKYYKKTAERQRAKSAAYRAAHPEWTKASLRRWAEDNKEYLREYQAKYRAANGQRRQASEAKRRAQKRGGGGSYTVRQIDELFTKQKGKCAACAIHLTKNFHKDHIIPLALGGSSDITNIQLLCKHCNCVKKDRHPIVFMQERGFLL